ncbi:Uncharacterised protein [uncultured archaeon]|nr:Uncharacterised protein [uncultured archaeon]
MQSHKKYFGVYPFLEITTKIGCKNNCSYCPQSIIIKAYKGKEKELSFENFVRAISTVPADVGICFSGFCEPFLNKECSKMIVYADQKGHKIDLFTTLVGVSEEDLEKIHGIKFSQFKIHLPSAKGLENIPVDEKYISLLKKTIEYKINRLCFVYHDEMRHELEPLVKGQVVYKMNTISRAGNLGKVKESPHKNLFCTQNRNHLHQNILLPNGDVYFCFMDYRLRHKIGNLFEQDYGSLFRSEEFLRVKNDLDSGGKNIICNFCERAIDKNSAEYLFFQLKYCGAYCKAMAKSLLRPE